MKGRAFKVLAGGFFVSAFAASQAQTIDPYYASNYSYTDLGSVSGVPANYGGLTLKSGDNNTLLIGGAANGGAGAIYSIGVSRDANNHITGFTGISSLYATSPNIDGGLAYGPGGILFSAGYPNNTLLQYKPGSSAPDRITNLSSFGIASSVGSVQFFGSRMKIASYNSSNFYDVAYTTDPDGLLTITGSTLTGNIGGAPEGIAYVPTGSDLFTNPSMLVSEFGTGKIATWQVDANGNPLTGTRKDFMSGLSGAEGAFIDPVTGDFLFSTYGGGNRVVRVSGFNSVPEPASMAVLGLGALGLLKRKRKS